MVQYEQQGALFSLGDGSWSVFSEDRRLVFRNGESVLEIPVQGPLRWARDGEELSFTEALAAAPSDLHGWMSLAAVIALRQCLAGVHVGVSLPPGYQEWQMLAGRVGPMCAWMHTLSLLEDVEVPPVPPDVDDGLGDGAGPR
jgi:hypothetical protein